MERQQTAFRNERGFTLIEVLVAMLALLFVLLASFAGTKAALNANLGNAMRNEAIKIAQEQLEIARTTSYAAVNPVDPPLTIQRKFRKANRDFAVSRTVQANTSAKRVVITVTWTLNNRQHSYSLETILKAA